MELEFWKQIKIEYFTKYEISNNGIVRNINTKYIYKQYNRNGYSAINLYSDIAKNQNFSIHRLVAQTFIENPNNYEIVNHKDGNKLNNNVENLEWCTCKQNTNHALDNKLIKLHVKKVNQYSYDGSKLIKTYNSIRDAEKETGISNKQISKVCRNKMPTAHGFVWKYVDDIETIQINEVEGIEVPDFPNYIVTRDGKVYSKSAKRYLVPNSSRGTKYTVKLCNNNILKDENIHSLVAKLYIPNPENKPYVHHINLNNFDNRVENLCWATMSEIVNYNNSKNEKLASPM
jgi:hypothetical protein